MGLTVQHLRRALIGVAPFVVLGFGAQARELGGCDLAQRVSLNGAAFRAEIADTEAERARGMMGRGAMALDAAMLFVYPSPKPVAYWMRNTLIPLDILFIDAQGTVVNIAQGTPHDETPLPSLGAVRYVLEIAGGQAGARGISAGARLLAGPCL